MAAGWQLDSWTTSYLDVEEESELDDDRAHRQDARSGQHGIALPAQSGELHSEAGRRAGVDYSTTQRGGWYQGGELLYSGQQTQSKGLFLTTMTKHFHRTCAIPPHECSTSVFASQCESVQYCRMAHTEKGRSEERVLC